MRAACVSLALFAIAAAAFLATPEAPAQDDQLGLCLTAQPPPLTEPARRLRFGVTPQAAGTVGSSQGEVAPTSARKRDAALERLQPRRRILVIRITRLLMSGGSRAIESVVARGRRFARAGFAVESQVRYHPSAAQAGDIKAWKRFVRTAARRLGRIDELTALTITNEVNLPISSNTSDGAFPGAMQAIVRGIEAADRALERAGRSDVELGFSYAYRYLPTADAQFWSQLGTLGTKRFRRALDYVGVQLYPGLFWPPVLLTETAGEATLEALTIVRECYMPKANLGPGKEIWITENGYATNLGHTEARQANELRDTLDRVHRFSGTLGVSDYRYFNLRDNRPNGTDLFDNVGLLRSDYSPKPAFGVLKGLIRHLGRRR